MTTERLLLALLLGAVGVGCVLVLYPFFSALLWAAILVFTTWPACEWLHTTLRLRRGAAAGVMVALIAVVIVLPLALAEPGGASDVNHLRTVIEDALRAGLPGSPDWVFDIPLIGQMLGDLWNRWAADITVMAEALKPYFGIVLEGGLGLLLGLANGVLLFVLSLFIAFFFYLYGEPIAGRLHLILRRIAGTRAQRLIAVTGATVRGVVFGILLTAVVQGILTALGLWVSGVPRPVLLGAVAGFLAVLPIGAPLVWIPAALWLMGSGHLGWGIFLAIYGVVAVSGADSVIRPWFIARSAQLPFLLTVLGVLGGALSFGLLGIFLGPVLLGIAYTLVNEWAESDTSEAMEIDH
ncbi:MAG TPA: AI-2E family transporter [Acetobacteraceae bacterium]|jgi:predicted PurR-regulated permease PerM|nr:AI-2E family transporter [Acetobacteraceae bacterium]